MFYNNDASDYVSVNLETGNEVRLHFENNTLAGDVKLDLSKVDWNESYSPSKGNSDREHVNDLNYTKEHFLNDVKGLDDNKIHFTFVNMQFFDADGKEIHLFDSAFDTSVQNSYGIRNVSLDGDILTISIFKDYDADNNQYDISNGADYTGNLVMNPESDNIASVKMSMDFYNDDVGYKINAILTGDDFKLAHK